MALTPDRAYSGRRKVASLETALYDVDVGSPGGARWATNQTDDPLADDVRLALNSLLKEKPTRTPPPHEDVIEKSLLGLGGDSPSLIWTAQSCGALAELGFTPDAECFQPHLNVIRIRLAEGNWRNPLDYPFRDAWVVRARHVAWITSCLSEYQPPGPRTPGRDREETLREREYRSLVAESYEALVGSPYSNSPAQWVSPKRGERAWCEVWPDDDGNMVRRPNLLTSIYATLGVCRCERHGYGRAADAWLGFLRDEQPANVLVDHLLSQIRVELAAEGPAVRLVDPDGRVPWLEPWARAYTLPSSVIGLLCLTLIEHARFIAQITEPDKPEWKLVHAAFTRAQRLGQALLARPALTDVRWSRGVDAFFQQGGEDSAWFIPSFSVCLRAVLETGVADPTHPLVQEALHTIKLLQIPPEEGGWRDPTYHTGLAEVADAKARATTYSRRGRPNVGRGTGVGSQHAELDVLRWARETETKMDNWGATPFSVHAAALALAATRRAWGRLDPRVLQPEVPRGRAGRGGDLIRELPPPSVSTIRIDNKGSRMTLTLEDGSYLEATEVANEGVYDLLRFIAEAGGDGTTLEEITAALGAREQLGDPDAGRTSRRLTSASAIRSRITKTNIQLGFELIESVQRADESASSYRIAPATTLVFSGHGR